MKSNKIKIKEIFTSIQGEGSYVGVKQLFIRFCNCNLKCNYCDTEFSSESDYEEHSPKSLAERIKEFDLETLHSVSLTGGEPLLQTEFLKEFIPLSGKKIYLETNATLADKLLEIKPFVDIISADIKLESATGIPNSIPFHEKFFYNCTGTETFAKIVFDENITDTELEACANLGRQFNIPLILQPMMNSGRPKSEGEISQPVSPPPYQPTMSVTAAFAEEILDRFLKKYPNTRLIPQVHKFLDLK